MLLLRSKFSLRACRTAIGGSSLLLRHSWITTALTSGMSTLDVTRLVGTSLLMIEKYYGHLVVDAARLRLANVEIREYTVAYALPASGEGEFSPARQLSQVSEEYTPIPPAACQCLPLALDDSVSRGVTMRCKHADTGV